MLSSFSQFIFGNSSKLFGGQHGARGPPTTWKDKNLCFDLRRSDLKLKNGEKLIASFFYVEDVKGNQDRLGLLEVTNLRLIWICCEKNEVNLSIGWRTVLMIFTQNLKDSSGASRLGLCVLTKYESTKYEFIFLDKTPSAQDWFGRTNMHDLIKLRHLTMEENFLSPFLYGIVDQMTNINSYKPYDAVVKVWQAYKKTQLYRHCRANLTNLISTGQETKQQRSGSYKMGELNNLPGEEKIEVHEDVTQLESRSIQHKGVFILTNVRLVWVHETVTFRNLSLPYTGIDSIKMKREYNIIISTYDHVAISNRIEFKCLSGAKSKLLFERIKTLHTFHKNNPKFGPESCTDCKNLIAELNPVQWYISDFSLSEERSIQEPNTTPCSPTVEGQELVFAETINADLNESTYLPEQETELELSSYRKKLNNYLNEQPIDRDRELIYSTGKPSPENFVCSS